MATEHSMAKKWAAILPFKAPSQPGSSPFYMFVLSKEVCRGVQKSYKTPRKSTSRSGLTDMLMEEERAEQQSAELQQPPQLSLRHIQASVMSKDTPINTFHFYCCYYDYYYCYYLQLINQCDHRFIIFKVKTKRKNEINDIKIIIPGIMITIYIYI